MYSTGRKASTTQDAPVFALALLSIERLESHRYARTSHKRGEKLSSLALLNPPWEHPREGGRTQILNSSDRDDFFFEDDPPWQRFYGAGRFVGAGCAALPALIEACLRIGRKLKLSSIAVVCIFPQNTPAGVHSASLWARITRHH